MKKMVVWVEMLSFSESLPQKETMGRLVLAPMTALAYCVTEASVSAETRLLSSELEMS